MDDSLPSSFLEDGSEEQELYGDEIDKSVGAEVPLEAEPSGEENPFGDSDDDEEDEVQVTIGKIEPRSVQFNVKAGTGAASGKLDVDNTAMINEKPIYDFDLASMEDRPWRKPGADITDYFNYGFTEDSWNTYCERQKKLRTEYPTQSCVNKALFSNIHLANPLAMPTNMGGRHLVSLTDGGHGNANTGNVKVLTDNGGRFKVHSHTVHYQKLNSDSSEPIVRTVIGSGTAPPMSSQGNTVPINTSAPPPTLDFSRPPPGLSNLVAHIKSEPLSMDGPPGVDGPPGDSHAIPTLGAPGVDMSMPPPGFNPSLPPPLRPPPMNLPPPGVPGVPVNMPPPQFGGMMPPQFHQRFPPMGGPMGSREFDMSRRESGDYDEGEDDRRRYRRRSRSRSPVKREATRRRDDDRRTSDRDRKDRDRDRSERSRRIRSRSASPERKRRDDREKRRGRDDDDDRRKRRYDRDDDDRRDRRERRRRDEESPQPRDSDDLGPPGVDSAE